MTSIRFNADARDVEHEASVEVPSDDRLVLISLGSCQDGWVTTSRYNTFDGWLHSGVAKWRELPAPPRPLPKIAPWSINHWHDPKVERPEDGKPIVVILDSGYGRTYATRANEWERAIAWCYRPEDGSSESAPQRSITPQPLDGWTTYTPPTDPNKP